MTKQTPSTSPENNPTNISIAQLRATGRIREAYPGPTWERLAAIKGRYDPTNLFRLNQNIPPTTEGKTTTQHKENSDGLYE